MARPQLEDGHTQIANEILEHLMRMYLPPNQWQVLLCIIRKTYGFHKKVDWIANSQIVEATGLVKSTVSRALKALEQQKLISRNKKHIGFQKDWENWQKLAEQQTISLTEDVSNPANFVPKVSNPANNEKLAIPQLKLADRKPKLAIQSTKVSSPLVTQKIKDTYTKDTIQKKDSPKQKFGEFFNVFLTDGEYKKLVNAFGEVGTKVKIEELSIAIASKGYKYKSHYATILNWSRRDDGKSTKDKPGRVRKPGEFTRPEDLR